MNSAIAINNTKEPQCKGSKQIHVKTVISLPTKVTLFQSKPRQRQTNNLNVKNQVQVRSVTHSEQSVDRITHLSESYIRYQRINTHQQRETVEQTQDKLDKDLQEYTSRLSEELVEDYCRIHFEKMAMQTAIDRFAQQTISNSNERALFLRSTPDPLLSVLSMNVFAFNPRISGGEMICLGGIQIMTSQQPKRAVQLIAFDSNKNPYLTTEAMSLLPRLTCSNLHVIAVAGKYRTGKSYILNRVLLGRSNGFNVGHTINACTKGLWMWPELVRLGDKECLIIDTEGLGSLEEGESTDLKIFLLALLFSSHLIYNSAGSIDEQALQSLSLVIQLAHVLQRQDRYDSQELLNTFPAFLWLLRDFSLKLEDASGNAISPSDYLENALKHQPKNTPAAQRKNQIRKQLRNFFQDRDCFALVRPTEQEKDLQNLSSLPEDRLRPQFVKLISDLRLRLEQSVKPKRVKGRVMNTEGFIQLCQYYTKALVDGKLPTISSHWDNLCLGQTHRILQKFQLQHLQAVQAAEKEGGQMEAAHSAVLKGGVEAIEKSFLGKLEKQLFRERFERKLEKQFQQLKMKATGRKGLELQMQLEQLDEIKNQEGDVVERYEAVIERLSQLCESTGNQQLYCEIYLYLSQFARSLLQEADAARIETQKFSVYRISMLEDQLQIMKKQHSERQEVLLQEIQQYQKTISQQKAYNSQQVRGNQERRSEQIMNLIETTKQQAENIKSFESAIAEIEKSNMQLQQQKQKLMHDYTLIEEQMQKKDIELIKKDQMLREESIKCRKLLREKEIVKHRYEEYLEENLALRASLDNLQQQLEETQRKTYQRHEMSPDLEEMRRVLRQAEQEKRNIAKLLNDERVAYQAMVQTPQNLSLVALKRNLELAQQQRDSLETKLNDLNAIFASCESFRCAYCHLNIACRMMKQHNKRCQPRTQLDFDVSYSFNQDGEINFQIEVQMDNRRWINSKSLTDLRELLINLQQNEQSLSLFQAKAEQQWPVNQNQQRRIFIGELLQELGHRIWEDAYLLCFLGIRSQSQLREEKENLEGPRQKQTLC